MGQRHAPAALYPPGKTQYPLYRRLGGPHGRSGQARKISPLPGFILSKGFIFYSVYVLHLFSDGQLWMQGLRS